MFFRQNILNHFNLCIFDPRRGNCFSYGQETLQLSAKGAEGKIGEVPVKNRPKWPFIIADQVVA